jgi:hypothetical protein
MLQVQHFIDCGKDEKHTYPRWTMPPANVLPSIIASEESDPRLLNESWSCAHCLDRPPVLVQYSLARQHAIDRRVLVLTPCRQVIQLIISVVMVYSSQRMVWTFYICILFLLRSLHLVFHLVTWFRVLI